MRVGVVAVGVVAACHHLLLAFSLVVPFLGCQSEPAIDGAARLSSGDVLFCFWNVENLFDDRDDSRRNGVDREYDVWFADNPTVLKQKLAKLGDALLKLNDGKGPDILAMVEVESVRVAELLQQALNDRLADRALPRPAPYSNVLMKEVAGGRHIAPAVLTRLPVVRDKTRTLGKKNQRILQGHIVVNGQELVVLVAHWTSRLRQGSERGRADYADLLHGAYRVMHRSNRAVDLLICGDFNDTPQDISVSKHLRATGDSDAVLTTKGTAANPPLLYNLMADKDPAGGFGTHYFRRWLIFDQIVVSPGLLDSAGWSCLPASVKTVNTLYRRSDRLRRPWRFGNEKDGGGRGFSDHFPVTVRLKVQG